jgi:penicillin-binding protein 1A
VTTPSVGRAGRRDYPRVSGECLSRGPPTAMSEPPTPTIHPSAARQPRFVRRDPLPVPAPPRPKPKLKKLRLAFILLGLSALALVSTLFGMLISVASDLPSLENTAEFRAAKNSTLYSSAPGCKEPKPACRIAQLTGNQNRILVGPGEISPHIKNAVIAIEDSRFYEHEGVDYASIARALSQDILHRSAVQGGSTITQQFVKNALSAQGDRSVFQKLRESALAYHLEREWSKDKILTQYLNTVYFGNGAYGIEAAVRTYFGDGDEPGEQQGADTSGVQYTPPDEPPNPHRHEAIDVTPAQAALLAGLIASPALYDPVDNRARATQRRNLVLSKMLEQRTITRAEYREAIHTPVPDEDDIDPPDVQSEQPYFTSWLTQQLVDRYGTGRVFGGGLKVKTTIDPELQSAAENAIAGRLAGVGPAASLVAIKNSTGEVKAMVGGTDFDAKPFNLATNGHRQPGSAIKPFILVRALADGVSPDSVWASQQKVFPVPGSKREKFVVRNYDDSYLGSASLWSATATSDNSVFAELGLQLGTKRIARMARRMGIRTRLSTNPAMTLGGLDEGVTPLEMAYAYSTIANKGRRTSGTLGSAGGPVGIDKVEGKGIPDDEGTNKKTVKRVFPESVGQTAQDMLSLVVSNGTGKAAQVAGEPIWGKTGTTENYGDAWFVGSNGDLTVAVWVGYPDKLIPMRTEFAGGPVAGGTYPAEIFSDFMSSWVEIRDTRHPHRHDTDEDQGTGGYTPYVPVQPSTIPPAEQPAPTQTAPAPQAETPTPQAPPAQQTPAPSQQPAPPPAAPAPAPTPPPTPAPAPTPPAAPEGGAGGVAPGEAPP